MHLPLKRELSGPAWQQRLVNWEHSSHVWLALALVFGPIVAGVCLFEWLRVAASPQNLSWLRDAWGGIVTASFFLIIFPLRHGLATGVGAVAGRIADGAFRRTVADDWRAWLVTLGVTFVVWLAVVSCFRLLDKSKARKAVRG